MTAKLYLESTRKPNLHFEVLAYDPETKKGKIMGSLGTPFDADMSKEALLKSGYKVIKAEDGQIDLSKNP